MEWLESDCARGLVVLVCALTLARAGTASAERTVACGESYAGHAELIGDCTGDITIYGGSLNLRGFTVSGGVYCQGDSCVVYSDPPQGALSGSGEAGGGRHHRLHRR